MPHCFSLLLACLAVYSGFATAEAEAVYSTIGAVNGPSFPPYLPGDVRRLPKSTNHLLTIQPNQNRLPWGVKTANNSNPYLDMPDTGQTRSYTFTLSRAMITPDGYRKPTILVNGQFPGPTIEANWGDWIQVNVIRSIFVSRLDAQAGTNEWQGSAWIRYPDMVFTLAFSPRRDDDSCGYVYALGN
ncbi:hypothetical protein Vi05172_g13512 [Venturia inaequalis]|nr:hypothetical protein Vi05172_g13512 [Venturia inaequalis]